MNRSSWLLIIFLLGSFGAQSQANRYMVFFSEKDTASWSVENPSAFLSERAIERRNKQKIDVTAQDFPVNENYVDQLSNLGVDVYFRSKWFNAVLVQTDESKVANMMSLSFVSNVEYVAPGTMLQREQQEVAIPENFNEPSSIFATSITQLKMLNADQMHNDGFQGEGMWVAVLDNGFKGVNQNSPFEHIYTNNKLMATRDFVGNTGNVYQYGTHGTQVLSTIIAKYGQDMRGTAPEANVVLCITEASKEYRIEEYNWLLALEYVDSLGVDVVNSSLGYNTFDDPKMDYSMSDLDGKTTVVARAANIAATKGMLLVVSAGNSGSTSSLWPKVTSPGDAKDVLTVGSVNKDWSKTGFSSYGPTADGRIKPDVCAIGNPTTVVNDAGVIRGNTGTSFAAPLIAGFAACIWQSHPEWNNLEVMNEIRKSGRNMLVPDTLIGYGVPNYLAISNSNSISIDQILKTNLKVYPNPFTKDEVSIDFLGADVDEYLIVDLMDIKGKRIFHKRMTSRKLPETLTIKFDEPNNGIYLLKIQTAKNTKTIKLVKI
jgi:serine protease AprX